MFHAFTLAGLCHVLFMLHSFRSIHTILSDDHFIMYYFESPTYQVSCYFFVVNQIDTSEVENIVYSDYFFLAGPFNFS